MEIVPAVLRNVGDIARVEFGSGYKWSKYSLDEEIRLAGKMLKEEDVFLAKVRGKFVGYVSIRIKGKIGEVGMSVLKNWHGKGVGSELMKFIIDYARKNNCKKIKGEAWEGNIKSRRLIEKFGFVIKSEKKDFYDNGDSLLIFELNLERKS